MEVAPKVPSFQRKVSGDKYLTALRRTQNGAVVTNPQSHGFAVSAGGAAADLLDQAKLPHWLKRLCHSVCRPGGRIYRPNRVSHCVAGAVTVWLICGRSLAVSLLRQDTPFDTL